MKKNGFTVVEVLIVLAILAILLNLLVMSVKGFQSEAQLARVRADLRALRGAVEAYYKNHNVYPLESNYQTQLWNESPKILEENLFDPFAPGGITEYSYGLSPDKTYYILYSIGVDKDGTATIANDGTVKVEGSAVYISNGENT
jgi:prepilin-type N-terminal cleavage/methylation domain-containing protein